MRGKAWVLAVSLTGAARGQEGTEAIRRLMDTPVISATRVLQAWDWAPATVHVIDKEEIRRRRYRSLHELLEDLPEFKVDRASDYDSYHAISARGIRGQTRFVILLDGVRVSGPTNEPVPLLENFPLHQAFRVEVMVGPGSALFGADAFAGVINILTRGPEEGRSGEWDVEGGGGRARRSSFFHHQPLGDDGTFRILGFRSLDPQADGRESWPDLWSAGVAAHRSGTFLDLQGAPVTPLSPVSPELTQDLEARGALVGLRLAGFEAFLFHREGTVPTAVANRPEYSVYNDNAFLRTRQTTLNASYRWGAGPWSHLALLTGQRLELDPRSNYRNALTLYEPGYEFMASSTLRWEQQVTWRGGETVIHGGLVFEGQDAVAKTPDLQAPAEGQGPIRGKLLGTGLDADVYILREGLYGAYLLGQRKVGNQVELTLGLRWERHARYRNTLHPRVGLVWKPRAEATWKILLGSAYLAPSPFDAYNHYGTFQSDGAGGYRSAFWHLPNPNLQPMRLLTAELGHYRILGAWRVGGTGFMTEARRLFGVAPDSATTNLYGGRFKGWPVDFIEVPVNQGTLRLRGLTLQGERVREVGVGHRIRAGLYASWMAGRLDSSGRGDWAEAPYLSPWSGRLLVDVDWGSLSLGARWLAFGRQRILPVEPSDPTRRQTLPGFHRMDATLSWQVRAGLLFHARLENALDARHQGVPPQSDINPIEFRGTPQLPRRWSLGAEVRW